MDTAKHAACAAIVALAAALVLTGCVPAKPVFDLSGAPLTVAQAESLAKSADLASVASVDVAHAPQARQRVLADLRATGATGDRAATLLTKGFPPDAASVPVLVRVGAVDGRTCLIAVEAWGDASGALTHRRLWLFDFGTEQLIKAGSYR
jgi:hypothetical protein